MMTSSDSDYGSPLKICRRGLMLVLSSPSGTGKTTISRALLDRDKGLVMSVSVTTRDKRREETAGVDYHFIEKSEFNLMVNREELLEYAKVFGNYYGTPRAPVEEELAKGHDVLFDVDWQGAQQLEQSARDDFVGIFILPPSTAELERRLHDRAQDSDVVVSRRMAQAADEMSHWSDYDYIIINNDAEDSVTKVQAILDVERLRRKRQIGLAEFVKGLREGQ